MIGKLIISFAVAYLILVVMVYLNQKHLLFFPDRTPFDECPSIVEAEGEIHQLEKQNARFYLIHTGVDTPKGYVLHFHGNGGRACGRYHLMRNFLEMGYHLVLAEYPGYAENKSLPDQDQLLKSAMAVYHAIRKTSGMSIVLYGESLGAAVATYVAANAQDPIKALILQSPFPSIAEVGQYHYPFLPVKWLSRYPFPAEQWAAEVPWPVFTFHGDGDEIIPLSFGLRQHDAFANSNKVFWEVSGANHNDLISVAGDELWRRVKIFLGSTDRPN